MGNKIDSIWITNQNTNEKIKILANETLNLIHTTGSKELPVSREKGVLFPNPCTGESFLSFSTLVSQNVEIKVINILGETSGYKRQELPAGFHEFRVNFPASGIYTVFVMKDNLTLSYKVICISEKTRKCTIEYTGEGVPIQLKNGTNGKNLNYEPGQVLLYSVYSTKRNSIVTDSPSSSKSYTIEFYECIDPSYRGYPIVKIGAQTWMAENLAYLPAVYPPEDGSSSTPRYYVHSYSGNNVSEAKETKNYSSYGVLYNWPAAMANSVGSDKNPSGVRGICPEGWHLPSDAEWKQLEIWLGLNMYQANGDGYRGSDQGNLLKSIYGWTNGNGTNSTGFSAIGGGNRGHNARVFGNLRYYGYWWSSMGYLDGMSFCRSLGTSEKNIFRGSIESDNGLSVRCVKD